MGDETIIQKLKNFIASVSFKVFLWSIDMTADEYWTGIYKEESLKNYDNRKRQQRTNN